jgi:hypothetical protein
MMMINILLPVSLLLVAADAGFIAIQVQHLDAGSVSNVAGAAVNCFDEDFADGDDAMSTAYTASNGKAIFEYRTLAGPSVWNPFQGWDWLTGDSHNPDIYCIITKSGNYPVSTLFVAIMDLLYPFRSAL